MVAGLSSLAGLSFLLFDRLVIAVPWNDEQISIGCFVWAWTDPEATSEQAAEINTIEKCVKLCRDSASCDVFKFIAATRQCYIGTGTFGGDLVQAAEGDISGPKTCEFPAAACSAQLKSDAVFPAATQAASMTAWTTGFQPQATQCWERFENSTLMPCSDAVTEVGGLEDVKKCSGLTAIPSLNEAQCKARCEADVTCSVWLMRSGGCMNGLGLNCFGAPEPDATAGGRIVHGSTRDLAPMTTKKIADTAQIVFSKAEMQSMGEEKAKQRCRDACRSNIECQYWQLMEDTGCWNEAAVGRSASYPLTTAANTDNAGTVIDGNMIQHSCASQAVTQTILTNIVNKVKSHTKSSSDSSSSSSFSSGGSESSGSVWPWWAWVLLALLLLCCLIPLIAGILFGMGVCEKKKAKKKRKVNKLPVVEEQAAVPSQVVQEAQPVYMVQQQVPVPTTVASVPMYQTAPAQLTVPAAAPVQYTAPQAAPVQYMAPQATSVQYTVPQAASAQYTFAASAPQTISQAAPGQYPALPGSNPYIGQ
eukprot:TRINITY_DN3784_c0_g1_i3.p1 TRINITY_DN3784_c0_g1~~TRINITY_DN3784_c0_g1_i3.p1  ORF type:complete len:555 (-),score=91.78 TRINITY_DN3784_c0_g1_i3:214-1812(-)